MASQPPKISLSFERHAQLSELRDALGLQSYSETVGKLLAAVRPLYEIPHTIPGVGMFVIDEGVSLRFDNGKRIGLSHDGARLLAKLIREYVADPKPRKTALISAEHLFAVRGVGRAVAVCLPADTKSPKLFAPDLALEFADLLEAKARG